MSWARTRLRNSSALAGQKATRDRGFFLDVDKAGEGRDVRYGRYLVPNRFQLNRIFVTIGDDGSRL